MTGRLVPPADSDALARAMVDYFKDPSMARQHGRAGRQVVERRFSLERMVEEYHRLYGALIRHGASDASVTRPAAPGPHTDD